MITIKIIAIYTKELESKVTISRGFIAEASGLKVLSSDEWFAIGKLSKQLRSKGIANEQNTSSAFMRQLMHQPFQIKGAGADIRANPEYYGFVLERREIVVYVDTKEKTR